MTRISLRLALPLMATAAALASSAPAGAVTLDLAPILDDTLTAGEGTARGACHTRLRPGTPGVATGRAVATGAGAVQVHLTGTGDWDVALFDLAGKAVAAGASPDGTEVASGWITGGQPLTVQACRRTGDAPSARVLVEHAPLPADAGRIEPPQMVSVRTPTRAAKTALTGLGLDLSEHAGSKSVGAVLHGAADRAKLRDAGLGYDVLVDDLVAQGLAEQRQEDRYAARVNRSTLPTGRDSYRVLADYESELKALAAQHPTLVKLITLPHKTYEGREVMGVEIAADVQREDGRPSFFNMGVHHAREWPAAELSMEWAHELVNGYLAGDPRATRIVRDSRSVIVPVVNPDGFNSSRSAAIGDDGKEGVDDTVNIATSPNEYRRKNCRSATGDASGSCLTLSVGLAEPGVDPNRNYGALWGGPGADQSNPLAQTYPGPGPFSEPESRNVRDYVATHQVQTLITNHTTAGLVLRAPGIASLGDAVDEPTYKALGDAMAKENGYFSQKSFELYDTTGTTEDWTYNVAGGFGFTFEIFCGQPNYTTGDCDAPFFHPRYSRVVAEWDGTSDQSNHVADPGPAAPYGMEAGYDGKGNREAYYIAAESTLNEARHSVVEGNAPAGATLRLRKAFKTETFPQADGKPIVFDDALESTMTVGADGKYRWHTNPSTRPIVAKAKGDPQGGKASPPETETGGPVGMGDGAAPGGTFPATSTTNYNDHPFTAPLHENGIKNATLSIAATWDTPTSDWDMEVMRDVNGDGLSAGDPVIATSATGTDSGETVTILPEPGQKYVVRMTNFAAVESYTLKRTYTAPLPFEPAQRESWSLTCEVGGKVLETQAVLVDRGQVARADLDGCRKAVDAAATPSGTAAGAQPPAGTAAGAQPTACASASGLRTAKATAAGRGVRFAFSRRVKRPVTISVFQQSSGRRVTGERLVARFAGRSRGLRWNGRANRKGRRVTDGYLFARYRIETPSGQDTRRITLRRAKGRFSVRPAFHRRASCGVLRSFKLGRPVFGGTTRARLKLAATVSRTAKVRFDVLRGKRVIKRYATRTVRAGKTLRRSLAATGLRRGDVRVRVTVTAGDRVVRSTLTSRRL